MRRSEFPSRPASSASRPLVRAVVGVGATLLLLTSGTLFGGQGRQSAPPPPVPKAGAPTAPQPAAARGPAAPTGQPIHVLFLGMDQERPHNPAKMFPYLAGPLARRGIQLTYVADQASALDPES